MIRIKSKNGENNIRLRLGLIVLFLLFAIALFLNARQATKPVNKSNQGGAGNSNQDTKQQEEYIELKQLFRQYQSNIWAVIEGFTRTGIITNDSVVDLGIDPDGNARGDLKLIVPSEEEKKREQDDCSIATFYMIREDLELCTTLKTLAIDKGILRITYVPETHEVQFSLNTDKIPYIMDDGNLGAQFIYSEQKDCEKKGYRQIRDNWYMYILPRSK